jgi:hypothetical protein
MCNLLTEVSFGSLLHLGQNHSANLLGSLEEGDSANEFQRLILELTN